MSILDWLRSGYFGRGKALSLYKQGKAKAKKHDHEGALEAYTTLIRKRSTPAELLAMVLYHRALVYVAAGDSRKGIDDLDAVLAMKEALGNVKIMARHELTRMESQASESQQS